MLSNKILIPLSMLVMNDVGISSSKQVRASLTCELGIISESEIYSLSFYDQKLKNTSNLFHWVIKVVGHIFLAGLVHNL